MPAIVNSEVSSTHEYPATVGSMSVVSCVVGYIMQDYETYSLTYTCESSGAWMLTSLWSLNEPPSCVANGVCLQSVTIEKA